MISHTIARLTGRSGIREGVRRGEVRGSGGHRRTRTKGGDVSPFELTNVDNWEDRQDRGGDSTRQEVQLERLSSVAGTFAQPVDQTPGSPRIGKGRGEERKKRVLEEEKGRRGGEGGGGEVQGGGI